MELRHLRYFVAVADAPGFSQAARNLGIAQPPLSVQIRSLETQLGVRLFDRQGRRTTLTAAGRSFLGRARKLLADADRAVEELQDQVSGRAGRIVLQLEREACSERVLRRLRKFGRKHAGVRISMQVLDNKNDMFDACILRTAHVSETDVMIEAVKAGVALPPKHRLLERETVRREDLLGESLIASPDSTRSELEETTLHKIALPITSLSTHRFVQVSCGLGIAVCGSEERSLLDSTFRPFDGEEGSYSTILRIPPKCDSPAITALLTFLKS